MKATIVIAGHRLALVGLALALGACLGNSTGVTSTNLQQAQAEWKSHNLTRYVYQYETQGFFNAFDGQAIRLVVIGDTVRSAQFVATDGTVPMTAALFPTIDGLFADAIAAQQAGRLVSISFDSIFGFPSRMQISGPPDASGAILASHLQLVP